MQWLKHAFAIPTADAFVPTPDEHSLVRRVSAELERRGLLLPAIVMLESCRPLGGVGAQALWFCSPWFSALMNADGLQAMARLLERPGGIDWIIDQLQSCDEPGQAAPGSRPPVSHGHSQLQEYRSVDIDGLA